MLPHSSDWDPLPCSFQQQGYDGQVDDLTLVAAQAEANPACTTASAQEDAQIAKTLRSAAATHSSANTLGHTSSPTVAKNDIDEGELGPCACPQPQPTRPAVDVDIPTRWEVCEEERDVNTIRDGLGRQDPTEVRPLRSRRPPLYRAKPW